MFEFKIFGCHHSAKHQIVDHDFKNNDESLGTFPRQVNLLILELSKVKKTLEVLGVHFEERLTDRQAVFFVENDRGVTVNFGPDDFQEVDVLIFRQRNHRGCHEITLLGNDRQEVLCLVKEFFEELYFFFTLILRKLDIVGF